MPSNRQWYGYGYKPNQTPDSKETEAKRKARVEKRVDRYIRSTKRRKLITKGKSNGA